MSSVVFLDFENFVLVPVSVYNNRNLNSCSLTKPERPKYQSDQNLKCQINTLRKELTEKCFAEANSLVYNILSCPCFDRSSNSQFSILEGVETRNSLSDSAHKFCCSHTDVTDINFTSLEAAGKFPTLVLNQSAKNKERKAGSPSKFELQKF